MQELMASIASLFGWLPSARPPDDDAEGFQRREAELQQRLSRLESEVDVIQRVESSEDSGR